ncbi:hypothetical protein ACIBCT_01485 [Streptosporangium sp. NPDC050855]|uniref:hypothetical protein n=1 Tax=Streptosporangium sp. NPDC050855 TaxID=3366194 RepID=UPI0037A6B15D
MPLDALIDAVVAAVVLPLLPLSARRPGRTPVTPGGSAKTVRPEATRSRPVVQAAPGPLAASADDFGATVLWRYPEGVRPVRPFTPRFLPVGNSITEKPKKGDSQPSFAPDGAVYPARIDAS